MDRRVLSHWAHALVVVNFDLELGPTVERCVPSGALSERESSQICKLAFPDSHFGQLGEFRFSFVLSADEAKLGNDVRPRFRALNPSEHCGCLLQLDPNEDNKHAACYSCGHLFPLAPRLNCHVVIRQWPDSRIRRGFLQKALVLVTPVSCGDNFFQRWLSVVALFFFQVLPSSDVDAPDIPLLNDESRACTQTHRDTASSTDSKQEESQPVAGDTVCVWKELGDAVQRLSKLPVPAVYGCEYTLNVKGCIWRDILRPPAHLHSQHTRIFSYMYPLRTHWWAIYQLVLCNEPLFLIAPTPHLCDRMSHALTSLIAPLSYHGNFRPFITIYDKHMSDLLDDLTQIERSKGSRRKKRLTYKFLESALAVVDGTGEDGKTVSGSNNNRTTNHSTQSNNSSNDNSNNNNDNNKNNSNNNDNKNNSNNNDNKNSNNSKPSAGSSVLLSNSASALAVTATDYHNSLHGHNLWRARGRKGCIFAGSNPYFVRALKRFPYLIQVDFQSAQSSQLAVWNQVVRKIDTIRVDPCSDSGLGLRNRHTMVPPFLWTRDSPAVPVQDENTCESAENGGKPETDVSPHALYTDVQATLPPSPLLPACVLCRVRSFGSTDYHVSVPNGLIGTVLCSQCKPDARTHPSLRLPTESFCVDVELGAASWQFVGSMRHQGKPVKSFAKHNIMHPHSKLAPANVVAMALQNATLDTHCAEDRFGFMDGESETKNSEPDSPIVEKQTPKLATFASLSSMLRRGLGKLSTVTQALTSRGPHTKERVRWVFRADKALYKNLVPCPWADNEKLLFLRMKNALDSRESSRTDRTSPSSSVTRSQSSDSKQKLSMLSGLSKLLPWKRSVSETRKQGGSNNDTGRLHAPTSRSFLTRTRSSPSSTLSHTRAQPKPPSQLQNRYGSMSSDTFTSPGTSQSEKRGTPGEITWKLAEELRSATENHTGCDENSSANDEVNASSGQDIANVLTDGDCSGRVSGGNNTMGLSQTATHNNNNINNNNRTHSSERKSTDGTSGSDLEGWSMIGNNNSNNITSDEYKTHPLWKFRERMNHDIGAGFAPSLVTVRSILNANNRVMQCYFRRLTGVLLVPFQAFLAAGTVSVSSKGLNGFTSPCVLWRSSEFACRHLYDSLRVGKTTYARVRNIIEDNQGFSMHLPRRPSPQNREISHRNPLICSPKHDAALFYTTWNPLIHPLCRPDFSMRAFQDYMTKTKAPKRVLMEAIAQDSRVIVQNNAGISRFQASANDNEVVMCVHCMHTANNREQKRNVTSSSVAYQTSSSKPDSVLNVLSSLLPFKQGACMHLYNRFVASANFRRWFLTCSERLTKNIKHVMEAKIIHLSYPLDLSNDGDIAVHESRFGRLLHKLPINATHFMHTCLIRYAEMAKDMIGQLTKTACSLESKLNVCRCVRRFYVARRINALNIPNSRRSGLLSLVLSSNVKEYSSQKLETRVVLCSCGEQLSCPCVCSDTQSTPTRLSEAVLGVYDDLLHFARLVFASALLCGWTHGLIKRHRS